MSDDRTTELLPCPFCGGDDLSEGPYSPYVICNGCGAFGPGNSDVTHEEAIEAWNTRTPEQAIAATLGNKKAKAHPYGYEPDTGAFDVTRCECGCLNDISATYCNDCGGEIEIDINAEKEIYHTPQHSVFAEKHDDGSLEFGGKRYVTATIGGGECECEGTIEWQWAGPTTYYEHELSCGHVITSVDNEPPNFCEECGAKVWKAVKR